jgi:hypothetical protein
MSFVLASRVLYPDPHAYRSLLTKPERRNYIDAIKCLHSKPALTPATVAPGARSRFDDFVVTHVLQTYSVHGTVITAIIPSYTLDSTELH